MKRFVISTILGVALAAALGFGIFPPLEETAFCENCTDEMVTNARKIFEKFNEECAKLTPDSKATEKQCLADKTYDKILPKLKALAKSNNFGASDQILFVGEEQHGVILAGKNRTFLAGAPSSKNTMEVTISDEGGDGGASAIICAIDKNGQKTLLDTLRLDSGKGVGFNRVDVSGIKGKIVQIEVTSFGKLLRRLKYGLKLS